MASYARTQASNKNQMPVLAQAKPAIICSQSPNYPPHAVHYNNNHHQQQNFNTTSITGVLSEKINTALKFSPTAQEREIAKLNFDQKLRHIEDESVLQKQNASNQMRQAAVMAAVASQQKVRLSATERLALTAKRPTTNQQIQAPKQQHQQQHQQPQLPPQNHQPPLGPNQVTQVSNRTPLPTLETLLAVQRQLQQHTKQHLNSVPQQLVNTSGNDNYNNCNKLTTLNEPISSTISTTTTTTTTITQQRNKPLPPSPPKSPSPQLMKQALAHAHANYANYDTYDKDLPPLPASISPSTSNDDSQLNSLESHQSSPATSLVSLPPPPPPISSYLEQYDEVNSNCHQSNSSTPSIASSSVSEISSVKQFLPMQVKPSPPPPIISSLAPKPTSQTASYELPLPYPNQSQTNNETQNCPQILAPKQALPMHHGVQRNNNYAINPHQHHHQQQQVNNQQVIKQYSNNNPSCQQLKPASCPPEPQVAFPSRPVMSSQNEDKPASSHKLAGYKPQINYQQHMFTLPASPSPPIMPPPPPPLTSGPDNEGFDEPDSGSFRFPTPPPPDLLLEGEEDDDFQCQIPTPPSYKSMSVASFADFNNKHLEQQQPQQKQSPSSIFNSSTFSAANSLQPPPLFRQQQQQLQSQQHQQQPVQTSTTPQLTVHINNDVGGLLSTANSNHLQHHRQLHHQAASHHHIMMRIEASSSSPSSSSDGDGHSSNSSSSTSGIHSSIDSPCSSNSKLDDFNYGIGKLGKKLSSSKNYESSKHKGSTATAPPQTSTIMPATSIRPALKQKKTVSFSDKVELVACADEQSDDHLPNPLLARVLAGKLQ